MFQRAALKEMGVQVGPGLLVFGCRDHQMVRLMLPYAPSSPLVFGNKCEYYMIFRLIDVDRTSFMKMS